MAPTFAIALALRPLSANKKPGARWTAQVQTAARAAWAHSPIDTGWLTARIVWFHHVKTEMDVDNIPKRLLDALKQLVFDDDFRVAKCVATRIDARRGYQLVPPMADSPAYDELLRLLDERSRHVLYIEIRPRTESIVYFDFAEVRR